MLINRIHKKRRKNKLYDEINITPMVDVMLVLLVIFMIVSPVLVSHCDVNLPTTKVDNPPKSNSSVLEIFITKYKKIYFSDILVSKNQLQHKLTQNFKIKPDATVVLCVDNTIHYKDLMNVMETIQMSGYKKISLISETSQG